MGALGKVVFVATLAFVLKMVVDQAMFMNAGRVVYEHRPGRCSIVPGVDYGSEDMVMLPSGLVFISSGLVFDTGLMSAKPERPGRQGRIFAYDLHKAAHGTRATELRIVSDGDFDASSFNPHGIDVYSAEDEGGAIYLYVINHHPQQERVEVFRYDGEKSVLTHKRSITSPLFSSLNNLVVIGKDEFYTTRMTYYRTGVKRTAEMFLHMPWSSVLYHSPEGATSEVAQGLHMSNGINLSPDKKYLYVTAAKTFYVYERNAQDPAIIYLIHERNLHSGLDNVNVHRASGDVWIGAHPVLWKTVQHMDDPDHKLAPSQVLRLRMSVDGRVSHVEEVFVDDGHSISGSAVALYDKGNLLVGSVCHKLMYCECKSLQD